MKINSVFKHYFVTIFLVLPLFIKMQNKKFVIIQYVAAYLICCLLIISCNLINGNNDIDAGEIIWSVDNIYSSSTTTQPLIDGDKVFVFHDGFLRAYQLKSGDLIWSQTIFTGGTTRIYSYNLLSDKNNVYIDIGFRYRSYDKKTGNLNWNQEYTSNGSDFSGLGVAKINQNSDYLFLPRRGKVLMVNKINGVINHEFLLNNLLPPGIANQGAKNPLPSPFDDNLLYIPTALWDNVNEPYRLRGNLFAYNIGSGELVWELEGPGKVLPTEEFETTDSMLVASPMNEIRINEKYVVVASNPTMMLVDRLTGDLIWHIPLKDKAIGWIPGYENAFSGVFGGLEIDDSGIYITSADGYLRKLDWKDGSEIWSVEITFTNTTPISISEGKVYFTNSGGGGIWVVDAVSGNVIYNSNPPGKATDSHDVYLSTLGVGNGYMVNVGSKRVYALRSFE